MPRDPIVMSLRRQLAREIVSSLGPSAYYRIAESFGIRQPRWSELERGKVERCTIEWLIRRIGRLGGSVQITVSLGDVGQAWHMASSERARAIRAARFVERKPGKGKSGKGKPGKGRSGQRELGEARTVRSAARSKSGIRVVL